MKGILRAGLHTGHAQNTFRAVAAFTGRLRHIHIHGTHPFAGAAAIAFFPVAADTQKGIVACRPLKDRNGAEVFAKRPVVPVTFQKKNPQNIV